MSQINTSGFKKWIVIFGYSVFQVGIYLKMAKSSFKLSRSIVTVRKYRIDTVSYDPY